MTVTVWVLGDQLVAHHPAILSAEKQVSRQDIIVLMIESLSLTQRLPYHAKKLVLLFSAMRHYAAALRQAGYRVDYRVADDTSEAIMAHVKEFEPNALFVMAASSERGRNFQKSLAREISLQVEIIPNTMFLCERFDPLPNVRQDQIVRQEQFYRKMRQHFELLMDGPKQPVGGKWNYDQKNRGTLPKDVVAPEVMQFSPNSITQKAIDDVDLIGRVTGTTSGFDLAVTREQASQAAQDFLDNRLPYFGTYEDGMRQNVAVLFHSKLAQYLNIGLLDPLELARAAEQRYTAGLAEINNVEGFIRQVIGWREYMYWQYHRLMPGLAEDNYWGSVIPLPGFFWHAKATKMNCLGKVIERVLISGYAHHIERLMVLSNFCLLASIHPQEVYEWFSSAFIDAYEWVMVPNVYGMGLYADGGKVATKPYIASANYIHRMSDYCQTCQFNHNQRTGPGACPFNFLYWHFLLKHQEILAQNPRMNRMLYNLRFLDQEERTAVDNQANMFLESLV